MSRKRSVIRCKSKPETLMEISVRNETNLDVQVYSLYTSKMGQ